MLRMQGKINAQYQMLWMGNDVSSEAWSQCVEPVPGVIFDVWYLAKHAGTADGIKVTATQSVTITPSGSPSIQGVQLDIVATKRGRVVDHPPAEQLVLTRDTSAGDSGKQWKVVVKDPSNPCNAVQ